VPVEVVQVIELVEQEQLHLSILLVLKLLFQPTGELALQML
jgi:hypothetical protein